MKKILLRSSLLISLILTVIFLLFSCRSDDYNITASKTQFSKDETLPCCNNLNPFNYDCEINPYWRLHCGDCNQSIVVSCDCCKQYWVIYGQDGSVDCTEVTCLNLCQEGQGGQ